MQIIDLSKVVNMYFTLGAFCTLNAFHVTVAHEVINSILQIVQSGRQEEDLKSLEYQIDSIK